METQPNPLKTLYWFITSRKGMVFVIAGAAGVWLLDKGTISSGEFIDYLLALAAVVIGGNTLEDFAAKLGGGDMARKVIKSLLDNGGNEANDNGR